MRWEKTRWTLVRVPNASFAQQAETDLETITEMFFNSSLLDWTAISKEWARLAAILEQGSEMHVLGNGTDLKFSVAGRKWLVGDGRINMPDGEIYTAPIHETVDGTISFEFPGVLGGRQVPDIQLTWKKGKLMEATSSKNQDFLHQILASDAGSSSIGEFAFGVNPYVDRFTTDILIDEKIGGTIHTALGRAYAECGGTNKSAIHWDIVKDTRTNSCITMDGKTIFENGKILI
jgi:aminopeptidase